MTASHDGWIEMTELDVELERLLGGAAPSAQAPAWCSDVALLVRTATAPARPDELEREDEIVSRMRELRLAALADALIEDEVVTTDTAEAGADDEADHDPALVATTEPLSRDESDASPSRDEDEDPAGDDEAPVAAGEQAEETGPEADGGARTGAYRDAGPGVVDLRTPRSAAVHDLEDYRAKHGGERYYRAKHAAARLEASKYPLARTVGRVVAIKAVAVATAVGVAAAAAAATTGIVATVVVPALTEPDRPARVVVTTTAGEPGTGTTAQRSHSGGTGGRSAAPHCASLLPACIPLPAALAAPVPPDVAKEAADLIAETAVTAAPKTSPTLETTTTSVAPPETTTTSTTVPEPPTTTPTTEPPPTTTPPTTEPPAPDPGTMSTQSTGGGDELGAE